MDPLESRLVRRSDVGLLGPGCEYRQTCRNKDRRGGSAKACRTHWSGLLGSLVFVCSAGSPSMRERAHSHAVAWPAAGQPAARGKTVLPYARQMMKLNVADEHWPFGQCRRKAEAARIPGLRSFRLARDSDARATDLAPQ